ncbi:mandelate racemase/muconate lactonizing enzyme family protein [Haloquadratum walsbyi]|jgi:L-alanine-DL-glutamate epimerase and related enzymes of enolase superfamily|uniref:o-succinylbenzoate synthase n=1 Tax=Haloquadratum walsbyi J07HQW2 TaxID=1238425 RepID=U1NID4_9EURY|nr:o-succinylbenzoate synthase [Haloquadratum walsbyi]ERG96945.1 MAG: L-alanine-DL-glutamate epimerase related enzymes of enolase superfamily [Haloquadratum walsbyi J07HQW2]
MDELTSLEPAYMKADPFTLGLSRSLSTANGEIEQRRGHVICIKINEVVGVGEATPLPDWTETHSSCQDALRSVSMETDTNTDTDIESISGISPETTSAAHHGVELACVDAMARDTNNSVAEFLSTDTPATSVPVNATIGDCNLEQTRQRAQSAVADGYTTIKLKVGAQDIESDCDRVIAARSAVGDDVTLRVDANGAWDRATAERFLETARTVDLEYIEQPLPASDLDGHALLRGHGVDIAVDESMSVTTPEQIFTAGAADIIVCKPMALGGPRQTVAVAREAEAVDIDTVVTTTIDGVIARTGALHVAAALPGSNIRACGLATASMLEDDLTMDPISIIDGEMPVPTGPGLAGESLESCCNF